MIVGTEWLVEATNCDAEKLREMTLLQSVFARIITDLKLKVVGEQLWHQFSAPGAGITGLVMLTESHLACHTYPEHQAATFNLYCCRTRPEWDWTANLQDLLGAEHVDVQKIERGQSNATGSVAVSSASCIQPSWNEILTTDRALKSNEKATAVCRHDNRQDDGVTMEGGGGR